MMFFENQQFQKKNTFTSNNSEILKTNCFAFFFKHPCGKHNFHRHWSSISTVFFLPGDLRRLGAYSLGCFRGVCVYCSALVCGVRFFPPDIGKTIFMAQSTNPTPNVFPPRNSQPY